MKAIARSAGTKENPTIINALENYRMVGCHCQEGDTNIKWMWVYENKPKRCECGYWFKLKQHEAPEYANMPL
jgi:cytochrome c oxidase subunit 5b